MKTAKSSCSKQSGVALITALLVVAIATVAAVQLAARQHLDIRRMQNTLARDQAYSYALAAEGGAMALLKHDLRESEIDHLGPDEVWHQPQMFEFQGAQLVMQIEDLHGRFDLNSLANLPEDPQQARQDENYLRFLTLLEYVASENPDAVDSNFDPEALIAALADWMDPDLNPRPPYGAEDDYYLGLENSYRTANQPLGSPSELMLVKGFTPELVTALLPFVTALPVETMPGQTIPGQEPPRSQSKINVNTAKPEVLMTLSPSISLEMAQQLHEQARERPWQTPEEFMQDPAIAGLPIAVKPVGLSTTSNYFLANIQIRLGRAMVPMHSLIYRSPGQSVRVISRGRGEP